MSFGSFFQERQPDCHVSGTAFFSGDKLTEKRILDHEDALAQFPGSIIFFASTEIWITGLEALISLMKTEK